MHRTNMSQLSSNLTIPLTKLASLVVAMFAIPAHALIDTTVPSSGYFYEVAALNSGMCLDVLGSALKQSECNGALNQHIMIRDECLVPAYAGLNFV